MTELIYRFLLFEVKNYKINEFSQEDINKINHDRINYEKNQMLININNSYSNFAFQKMCSKFFLFFQL